MSSDSGSDSQSSHAADESVSNEREQVDEGFAQFIRITGSVLSGARLGKKNRIPGKYYDMIVDQMKKSSHPNFTKHNAQCRWSYLRNKYQVSPQRKAWTHVTS